MTQIEALARRAAAAGVAIQTLSSFAVGENALAGICSGYGGIATTDFQEASVDWGNASANWSPAGRPLLCSSVGYVVAVNANRSAEYVHYDHSIIRTRSFHIEERNRTIQ